MPRRAAVVILACVSVVLWMVVVQTPSAPPPMSLPEAHAQGNYKFMGTASCGSDCRFRAAVCGDGLVTAPRPEDVQPLVERYAATLEARVTVIAADGTVLGDSERDPRGVREMENHAGRPEVQAALAHVGGLHHRSVKIADLLIAASAEEAGHVVWHYDEDFDRIARVTGQQCRWITPRGSA